MLSCTRLDLRLDAGADRQAEVEAVDLVLSHQHVAGEVDVGAGLDADTAAVDRVAADHDPIGQGAVEPGPNAGAVIGQLIAADRGPSAAVDPNAHVVGLTDRIAADQGVGAGHIDALGLPRGMPEIVLSTIVAWSLDPSSSIPQLALLKTFSRRRVSRSLSLDAEA